jgi:hypothetical protein
MRRSVRLFSFAFLITLPPGCSDNAVIEPGGLSLAPEAQFSTQPTRGFAFSDYLPLVPGLYGIKTYATGDGPITSQIVGPETAPYQPPITGVKMTLGDDHGSFASKARRCGGCRSEIMCSRGPAVRFHPTQRVWSSEPHMME